MFKVGDTVIVSNPNYPNNRGVIGIVVDILGRASPRISFRVTSAPPGADYDMRPGSVATLSDYKLSLYKRESGFSKWIRTKGK